MYAGGEFMTGDDIAQALFEYSQALAEEDAAASVEIPVLNDDGSLGSATFLVGPASQIVARAVDSEFDEVIDPEVVERLRQLKRQARPVARPEAAGTRDDWAVDEI